MTCNPYCFCNTIKLNCHNTDAQVIRNASLKFFVLKKIYGYYTHNESVSFKITFLNSRFGFDRIKIKSQVYLSHSLHEVTLTLAVWLSIQLRIQKANTEYSYCQL